ncbi:MAG: hypothetical protein OXD31_08585 [Chloroflexi bacterium]|nr:hypothetical protein [Chloroflexota bacterium]
MKARSISHHENPIWLLKHFSSDCDGMLWMGFKNTRDVKLLNVKAAFKRNDANTRIDYQRREDGTFQQVKSDPDEKSLVNFDGQTATAVSDLLASARQWRDTSMVPRVPAPETVEMCKRLIVAQARRPRESQDRSGLFGDKHDLYLDVLFKIAEEDGQQLPSRDVLLEDPRVIAKLDDITQNRRATFASGDHPILASKEQEFLAPLGLNIAVLDSTTAEFVIGSHGITITQGQNSWLPLAPDVAISFSNKPGGIGIGMCVNEFVEEHNRAALSASERIAGRSKEAIEKLLATLD